MKRRLLFGGSLNWVSQDWTASDDRVRGGKSQSYISCEKSRAEFYGTLDITALGGAGFASQRTAGDDNQWDLSAYDGIELRISKIDAKQYTFILKDEVLPPNPENGREQSTISYEFDFEEQDILSLEDGALFISWDQFKATYRGKQKKDAAALNVTKIKRMSLMMRSFFGTQEGDFSLTLDSIAACGAPPKPEPLDREPSSRKLRLGEDSASDNASFGKSSISHGKNIRKEGQSLLGWFFGKCLKL